MRYLRLIERVLDHVREIESAATNPARFIAQDGNAAWRKARDNEPTGFLTHDERALLVAHLFSPIGRLPAGQRWRERRDRALVAAFLGGGVKTGEAAQLTVDAMRPARPILPSMRRIPRLIRQARLAPFAIALLDNWISERKTRGLAGELLFPAAPSGRSMHKATMLRAIDAVVAARASLRRASRGRVRRRCATPSPPNCSKTGRTRTRRPMARISSRRSRSHRLHRAWQDWMGEQIRERDIAQARDSGTQDADQASDRAIPKTLTFGLRSPVSARRAPIAMKSVDCGQLRRRRARCSLAVRAGQVIFVFVPLQFRFARLARRTRRGGADVRIHLRAELGDFVALRRPSAANDAISAPTSALVPDLTRCASRSRTSASISSDCARTCDFESVGAASRRAKLLNEIEFLLAGLAYAGLIVRGHRRAASRARPASVERAVRLP